MNRAVGIALLVVGVLLLIFGIQESRSLASDVQRVFTDSPTDKSIWLIVGGAAAAAVGLYLTVSKPK